MHTGRDMVKYLIYYQHWFDTTAAGLLVPDGIIRLVVECFVTDVVYHMYLCLKSTVPKLYN